MLYLTEDEVQQIKTLADKLNKIEKDGGINTVSIAVSTINTLNKLKEKLKERDEVKHSKNVLIREINDFMSKLSQYFVKTKDDVLKNSEDSKRYLNTEKETINEIKNSDAFQKIYSYIKNLSALRAGLRFGIGQSDGDFVIPEISDYISKLEAYKTPRMNEFIKDDSAKHGLRQNTEKLPTLEQSIKDFTFLEKLAKEDQKNSPDKHNSQRKTDEEGKPYYSDEVKVDYDYMYNEVFPFLKFIDHWVYKLNGITDKMIDYFKKLENHRKNEGLKRKFLAYDKGFRNTLKILKYIIKNNINQYVEVSDNAIKNVDDFINNIKTKDEKGNDKISNFLFNIPLKDKSNLNRSLKNVGKIDKQLEEINNDLNNYVKELAGFIKTPEDALNPEAVSKAKGTLRTLLTAGGITEDDIKLNYQDLQQMNQEIVKAINYAYEDDKDIKFLADRSRWMISENTELVKQELGGDWAGRYSMCMKQAAMIKAENGQYKPNKPFAEAEEILKRAFVRKQERQEAEVEERQELIQKIRDGEIDIDDPEVLKKIDQKTLRDLKAELIDKETQQDMAAEYNQSRREFNPNEIGDDDAFANAEQREKQEERDTLEREEQEEKDNQEEMKAQERLRKKYGSKKAK